MYQAYNRPGFIAAVIVLDLFVDDHANLYYFSIIWKIFVCIFNPSTDLGNLLLIRQIWMEFIKIMPGF